MEKNMAIDFGQLKKSRQNQFDKLNTELNKLNDATQGRSDDDRFWKPEVDKAGNGYAIIRFLPAPAGEDVPFVRVWDHGFQGPGGWYIEKSLTTLGKPDPVTEYNIQLWNSGIESNKDQVRKQKRRLSFISNIYIVKDPARSDNEGKVFLFKYGKKIFDKLNEAMNPQFDDEKPLNPFDLWEGANFKLKIRNVEGYRNYDKSEFESASPLFDDDEELESVWRKEHGLKTFLDVSNFKSYEELKAKLNKVLTLDGRITNDTAENDTPGDTDKEVQQQPVTRTKAAPVIEEDDDSMDFFKRLAEED
jgi:predicted DNA-binding antitoxin AbrB/MazE fold protein